jgi:hypothetical protein
VASAGLRPIVSTHPIGGFAARLRCGPPSLLPRSSRSVGRHVSTSDLRRYLEGTTPPGLSGPWEAARQRAPFGAMLRDPRGREHVRAFGLGITRRRSRRPFVVSLPRRLAPESSRAPSGEGPSSPRVPPLARPPPTFASRTFGFRRARPLSADARGAVGWQPEARATDSCNPRFQRTSTRNPLGYRRHVGCPTLTGGSRGSRPGFRLQRALHERTRCCLPRGSLRAELVRGPSLPVPRRRTLSRRPLRYEPPRPISPPSP